MHAARFLDLFCGTGGLSRGLRDAGLQPAAGVDLDREALAAYRGNLPDTHAIDADLTVMSGVDLARDLREGIDAVVAGPPFILNPGATSPRALRHNHVWTSLRLVNELQPVAFAVVLAGSAGQNDMRGGLHGLVGDMTPRYHHLIGVVDAANVGVACQRPFTIILGVASRRLDPDVLRQAAGSRSWWFDPNRGWYPHDTAGERCHTPTVRDAIGDLPPAQMTTGPGVDTFDGESPRATPGLPRPAEVARASRDLHWYRPPSPEAHTRYDDTPPGHPRDRNPSDRRNPATGRAVPRLVWDRPAPRGRRVAERSVLHPQWNPEPGGRRVNRRITVQEATRILGLADDHLWNARHSALLRHLPGAVPLPLARAIGLALTDAGFSGNPDADPVPRPAATDHETAEGRASDPPDTLFDLSPSPPAAEGRDPAIASSTPGHPDTLPLQVEPEVWCTDYTGGAHLVPEPANDVELQRVLEWLRAHPDLAELIGDAIEEAIYYVLDGARTGRHDLRDPNVDSDERRSVGTKLQYHMLDKLDLPKLSHPDTEIVGIGVEIKGTVRDNWAIPREGVCGVTLLVRVDLDRWQHQTRLIRTHTIWLRPGANRDGKRGVTAEALRRHAIDLYGVRDLRPNPLVQLTPFALQRILAINGLEARYAELFRSLPGVVVPRQVMLTVGAGRMDPLRRARAARPRLRPDNLALLCGTWNAQRLLAARHGHDLTGEAWIALRRDQLDDADPLTSEALSEIDAE